MAGSVDRVGSLDHQEDIDALLNEFRRLRQELRQNPSKETAMTLDGVIGKLNRLMEQSQMRCSNADTFTLIYNDAMWGSLKSGTRRFCSGPGSYDKAIAGGYVSHVNAFLDGFSAPPRVVDLGCGDFNVGKQILPHAGHYLACDVVPDLIAENRRLFSADNLEFRVLDMAADPLPRGGVTFVRQVLQHLSNDDIAQFTAKVAESCEYLVLTEHLPPIQDFLPNLDKLRGPETRISMHSGVVLTAPPFNLAAKSERILCEFEGHGGRIQTVIYEFQ